MSSSARNVVVAPVAKQQLPHFFSADEFNGGTFETTRERLEQLCASIFGPDSDWVPVGNHVSVDSGHVSQQGAAAGDGRALASSFLCFRIRVQSRTHEEPSRVVVTHLFVDHAWAMTFGREAFGFPAIFAEFKREAGDSRLRVIIDDGLSGSKPPSIELTWQVDPTSQLPKTSLWQMIGADGRRIPFLQIKQMRDGIEAERACYRELLSGNIRVARDAPVQAAKTKLSIDAELLELMDLPLPASAETHHGYTTSALSLSVETRAPASIGPSARRQPALLQRRGDPQAAPPYRFTDVDIVGFKLPVRRALLRRLCDTWLNDPFPDRSFRYEPANVDLIVECLKYPSMFSENPPPGVPREAATRQHELVFRMLVDKIDEDGRSLCAPAVFCPFLFVDNIASLISGREVIGYPKLLARFEQYGDEGQFDACKIAAVTPDPAGRDDEPLVTFDCRFERKPRDVEELFGRQPAPPTPRRPRARRPSFDMIWWNMADLQSGGSHSLLEPWARAHTAGYRGLQVKRFLDAKDLSRPCYSQLVEFEYSLLKAEVSLPEHDATLHFPKSVYGIADAFGLSAVVPVPPGAWYRTRADFEFHVRDPLA
jgi:hypothetical protein